MYHEPDRSNRTIRGVFYLLGKTACESQQFQQKGFVAIHNQTVSLHIHGSLKMIHHADFSYASHALFLHSRSLLFL